MRRTSAIGTPKSKCRSGGLTLAPCPRPPSALCTRPCSPRESSGVGKRKKGRMWVQKRAVSDSFSKKEKRGTSGIYVQNASKRRSGCPRNPSISPRKPDLLNAQKATLLNHALPDKNTRSEEPPKKCSCEPDQKGRRMHCTVCSGRVWTRELPEKILHTETHIALQLACVGRMFAPVVHRTTMPPPSNGRIREAGREGINISTTPSQTRGKLQENGRWHIFLMFLKRRTQHKEGRTRVAAHCS